MRKKALKPVLAVLLLVSITIIVVVAFTARLNATLNRGRWIYQNNEIVGCGSTGDQCWWGTLNPNPSPDN